MLKTNKSSSVPVVLTILLFLSLFTFPIKGVSADDAKEDLAEKYRDAGYELQQQGDFNGALAFYTKAIALGGVTNPTLLNDVGIMYEQLGIPERAEEHYLKAIQLDDQYLPAYSNLAQLYLSKGFPERAFEYFRKRYELSNLNDPWGQQAKEELLKIKPEFEAWIIHHEANRMSQVLQQQREQELFDQVTQATQYYDRGQEYGRAGELEKALTEYNRALSLTPENPKIQKARQEVIRQLTGRQIKERSEIAIKKINAGDSYSARREIKQILSTIPNEPIFNSR